MSLGKIEYIKLTNFKAFQQETFNFDKKHVLIYGNNGSGKSSLYWGLYTYLQSALKEPRKTQIYFENYQDEPRSLVNVFRKNGFSKVEIKWPGKKKGISISKKAIETHGNIEIEKFALASDFVNFKVLINFYDETHKNELNIWDVFWKDVFPFIEVPEVRKSIRAFLESFSRPTFPSGTRHKNRTKIIKREQELILNVNYQIELAINTIEKNANNILKSDFDEQNLEVVLEYPELHKIRYEDFPFAPRKKEQFSEVKILMSIKYRDKNGKFQKQERPQAFLNEARLSKLAFAVRLGALKLHLSQPGNQILVLDDLLLSLDMGNRDPVLDLILDKYTTDYQVIFLTHELSLFDKMRRKIENRMVSDKWKQFELYENIEDFKKGPVLKDSKGNFQSAVAHFHKYEFPASANFMRKAFEVLLDEILPVNQKLTEEGASIWQLDNLLDKAKSYYYSLNLPVAAFEQAKDCVHFLLNPLSHADSDVHVFSQDLELSQTIYAQISEYKDIVKDEILGVGEKLYLKVDDQSKVGTTLEFNIELTSPLVRYTLGSNTPVLGPAGIKMSYAENGIVKTAPKDYEMADIQWFFKDMARKTKNEVLDPFQEIKLQNGAPIASKL